MVLGPRYDLFNAPWKGTYTRKKFEYLIPLFVWEKDKDVSGGLKGSLNIVPNTWISDDFRSVAFPSNEKYYVSNHPTMEYYMEYLIPQKTVWAEFDVCSYVRLMGCE
jgi:hypothetical protein